MAHGRLVGEEASEGAPVDGDGDEDDGGDGDDEGGRDDDGEGGAGDADLVRPVLPAYRHQGALPLQPRIRAVPWSPIRHYLHHYYPLHYDTKAIGAQTKYPDTMDFSDV